MRFKTLKTLAGMALLGLAVVFLSGCPNRQRGTVTEVSEPTDQSDRQTPPDQEQPPAVEADPNAWMSNVKDVFFDYDKAELRSDARMILQENVQYLKEHAGADMTLEGHCDERGTDEYNLALGQRRADAVRTYLVDLGISGTRLKTVSFGEERPFALGSDESAWSQNRRVHFVIK